MKYIKTDRDGTEEIFIFPREIDHDAFYESVELMRSQTMGDWERVHRKIVSAGFVSLNGNCYGQSITLKVKSDPISDTALLKKQMNL